MPSENQTEGHICDNDNSMTLQMMLLLSLLDIKITTISTKRP